MKHPRFVLKLNDIIFDHRDADSTYRALKEMGMVRHPFPEYSIQVIEENTTTFFVKEEKDGSLISSEMYRTINGRRHLIVFHDEKQINAMKLYCSSWVAWLIVLLATKGVEKHSVKSPSNKQGEIQTPYSEIIYVRPEKRFSERGDGTHESPRPHFRRGHIREQWYPSLGKHAKVWIEPCLVNADDGFIPEHKTYKLGGQYARA
jgi:hypothetical protein